MQISHCDLVAALGLKIAEALDPFVPHGMRCALLDFPNHGNVGDNAIWLGEKNFFNDRKANLVYVCDNSTYRTDKLKKRLRGGTIFIHGGGNLGDIWLQHQRFRERVISDFPNSRIVQLPQTIFFKEKTNLERARNIFNNHPDLTIFVRDERSLELARNEFHARSYLCPDMAFMLGNLAPPESPQHNIVWLSRTDSESRGEDCSYSQSEICRTDWRRDPPSLLFRANNFLRRRAERRTPFIGSFGPALACAYDSLAMHRLRRGCRVLSSGMVVVTDRLHAHILSLLMGIPNVIVGDKYGKVIRFHNAWTKNSALTVAVDSLANAFEAARCLERECRQLSEPGGKRQEEFMRHSRGLA